MECNDIEKRLNDLECECLKALLILKCLIKILKKGGIIEKEVLLAEVLSIVDRIQ